LDDFYFFLSMLDEMLYEVVEEKILMHYGLNWRICSWKNSISNKLLLKRRLNKDMSLKAHLNELNPIMMALWD